MMVSKNKKRESWLFASDETAALVFQSMGNMPFPLWHCPLINIEPLPNTIQFQDKEDIPNRIIFISANAVAQGIHSLISSLTPWISLPLADSYPEAWLMGGSIPPSIRQFFPTSYYPQNGNDSEALLADPRWHTNIINDLTIDIIKGEGGRDLLMPALKTRGARVRSWNVYRRLPNHLALLRIQDRLQQYSLPSTLIILSRESLKMLSQHLDNPSLSATAQDLKALPLYVHHWRIRDMALECGFKQVICKDGLSALILCILEECQHH